MYAPKSQNIPEHFIQMLDLRIEREIHFQAIQNSVAIVTCEIAMSKSVKIRDTQNKDTTFPKDSEASREGNGF